MLDAIRRIDELPVQDTDAVHITRQELASARRCRALERQAQRRARQLIDQAQVQVEAIQATAFAEGYAEGVIQAVVDLARGLCESQRLASQLRGQMVEAVRQLLGHLLEDSRWFDEMLEDWLAGQADTARMALQILLPEGCRSRVGALREHLERLGVSSVRFEFEEQERYVVRLADQLFEFDLESAREQLTPRVLSQLAGLPDGVRELDRQARQALVQLVSGFVESREEPSQGDEDAH
ncbi:invasion protein OrgB [Pseudomonas gingeri]|uniref:invasion protein OrgB n=1 Tax=Pseudomonas gingeri TaxID=117681 RepID=UPI0015A3C7F7|nr:invasion protein OrgB [Pseudomonas gingeri]NWD04189.1 invasion protein OrgB [Pseudomonas gingeri]NWD46748.1 invasion protein OrgB [Pseudomonas gingeri]NWE34179.1 invasion protein OrgB [Pseudomonas gingeri]NWE56569.1 invasion protein OrgB [Pseudomonas gingeri]NWF01055.1 invasion protein OrgB [Pseudomonas gingeri]